MMRFLIVKISFIVLFLILATSLFPYMGGTDEIDLRTREREFTRKAIDAVQKRDESALVALMVEYEPVVFNAIMSLASLGIRGMAEEQSQGYYYSNIAKTMAGAYAKQLNKQDLAQLIDRYASYNREEARTRMQAEALWRDAVSLVRSGKWEAAQETIAKALIMYRAVGDKTREADSLALLGLIYKNFRKEKECLRSYEEALQIIQRLGNIQGERTVINDTGVALSQFGNYREAVPYYQKALALGGKISDPSQELLTLKALGLAYDKLNENKEALDTYRLALKVAKAQANGLEEGGILLRMAVIHHELGQYKEAIPILEQALAIFQELKNFREQYLVLWHLGYVNWRMGENERSQEHYLKGLQVAVASGDEKLQAGALGSVGEIFEKTSKYNEARDYYLKSLALYQRTGDLENEAKTFYYIGNVLNSLGRYRESLDVFLKASEKAKKLGDSVLTGKILLGTGRTYYYLREYALASQNLLEAVELIDELNILELAKIDELLGMTALEVGKLTDAVRALESALKSYRLAKLPQDEARILTALGRVHGRLGENEKALEYFKNTTEISRTSGDLKGEAAAFLQIGSALGRMGRYAEALDHLTQSLGIAKKSGNPGDLLAVHYQIGSIYLNIGNSSKAREHYDQALHIARETGDKGKEGDILLEIASIIYYYQGNLKEGLAVIREALEKAPSEDLSVSTKAAHHLGFIYMKTGQYAEALETYQEVLKNYRKLNDIPKEPMALLNIGIAYYNLGRFDDAVKELNSSLQLARQIAQLEDIWWAEAILGKTLRRAGKPEEAVIHYEKAVEAIEEIYGHTKGFAEEERSAMLGEKSFVYQEFIELLLELHRKQPEKGYDKQAFLVAERAKSRTFQELMAQAGAKTAFGGDATFQKMITQEQQLIIELTNLRTLLTQEFSKPEKQRNEEVVQSLKDRIAKTEKALQDHVKAIDTQYPRYADLKRPKPLSVAELQEILQPDETVVSYALAKEKAVVFMISKKGFRMVELDTNPKELAQLVKQFRKGLDGIQELKDLEEFKPEVAYTLYQKLLGPLSSELKGITKLYIAADNILYTLAFEALVDQEINKDLFREARQQGKRGGQAYLGEYAALHYLVDTYTITYLPSAAMLRSLRKYAKPGYGQWTKPLIAFADPVFNDQEEQAGTTKGLKSKGISAETELSLQILTRSTGADQKTLSRLKESAEEADAIGQEVKGKQEDMYLRDQATEEHVYQARLKEARYLLFSTHGLLGGDFSGVAEPALALTLINNPPGQDGFLSMSEVLGLDLNAELIILSACNTTGKGDKAGIGEGFAGLTRSFMYAGTRSILVTHWSVESRAARDLMVDSFKAMPKETKPEALRQAKLKMKSSIRDDQAVPGAKLSLSHPFFWAPFVMVGEGN